MSSLLNVKISCKFVRLELHLFLEPFFLGTFYVWPATENFCINFPRIVLAAFFGRLSSLKNLFFSQQGNNSSTHPNPKSLEGHLNRSFQLFFQNKCRRLLNLFSLVSGKNLALPMRYLSLFNVLINVILIIKINTLL